MPNEILWSLIAWGALCLAVGLQWLAGWLLPERKGRNP
jgi:hypothetical protein